MDWYHLRTLMKSCERVLACEVHTGTRVEQVADRPGRATARRRMHGRPTLVVGGVGVGLVLEKKRHDRDVPIRSGVHQRSVSERIAGVDGTNLVQSGVSGSLQHATAVYSSLQQSTACHSSLQQSTAIHSTPQQSTAYQIGFTFSASSSRAALKRPA